MREIRKLPCIICPVGCEITVVLEDGKVESITGNSCRRGEKYAGSEVLTPVRTLTTTVKVLTDGGARVIPVRTEQPIPKAILFDAMREINKITLKAPVRVGEVVLKDILGTGVNVIATSNLTLGD
ncbi:MAG: DUF1667 domain-containing protein [Bacillota bacterium]|nr:DUF1667 domain-containing protein [Bacillota bacterium]